LVIPFEEDTYSRFRVPLVPEETLSVFAASAFLEELTVGLE